MERMPQGLGGMSASHSKVPAFQGFLALKACFAFGRTTSQRKMATPTAIVKAPIVLTRLSHWKPISG